MKNIIIALLLIFSVNGFGQTTDPGFSPTKNQHLDSILKMMRDSGLTTYGTPPPHTFDVGEFTNLGPGGSNTLQQIYDTILTQHDTVQAIFLYSDTENKDVVGWQYGIQYETKETDYSVKWMNGYTVFVSSGEFYMTTEYLDDKKRPLSKNIIVWQTISK